MAKLPAFGDIGDDLMEDASSVPSVHKQYETGLYSTFVELPCNQPLYDEYFHFDFLNRVRAALEPRIAAAAGQEVSVLDLGCGNGVLSRKLKALFPQSRVVGVDQSEAMLEEARRLTPAGLGIEFLGPHDAAKLPSELGCFDAIVSGFVLCHVHTRAELQAWFDHFSSRLKPNGMTLHIIPELEGFEGSELPDGSIHRVRLPLEPPAGGLPLEPLEPPAGTEEGQQQQASFVEVYDCHWRAETYRAVLSAAGLRAGSVEDAQPSERGAEMLRAMLLPDGRNPLKIRLVAGVKPPLPVE